MSHLLISVHTLSHPDRGPTDQCHKHIISLIIFSTSMALASTVAVFTFALMCMHSELPTVM